MKGHSVKEVRVFVVMKDQLITMLSSTKTVTLTKDVDNFISLSKRTSTSPLGHLQTNKIKKKRERLTCIHCLFFALVVFLIF